MSLLTEQEITQVVRDAANGSAIRRDGSTSYRIARAIEAAVIEKIKAQGATAYISPNVAAFHGIGTGVGEFSYVKTWNRTIPLYRLPEGD